MLCPEIDVPCFLAGDLRVNLQEALTTLHTIWFREHNTIAQKIRKLDSSLDADKVFEIARQIVIAELQKIAYEDYFPIIFGGVYKQLVPDYVKYNSSADPRTPNAYDAGAGRFGHSMVQFALERLDANYKPISAGNLLLSDAFFNTSSLREYGADPLARGLVHSPSRVVDRFFTSTLTHQLFSDNSHSIGMDLISINIQRGRDHGIPPYVAWKLWAETTCGIVSTFGNDTAQDLLVEAYGSIENVDLYAGGVSEAPLGDGLLGATFACILAQTFTSVRDGDRFYYENTFTADQINEIKTKATHSRVICDNTGIQNIQKNAFLAVKDASERVKCSDIPSLNLDLWVKPAAKRTEL